jgi:hypothetical protein
MAMVDCPSCLQFPLLSGLAFFSLFRSSLYSLILDYFQKSGSFASNGVKDCSKKFYTYFLMVAACCAEYPSRKDQRVIVHNRKVLYELDLKRVLGFNLQLDWYFAVDIFHSVTYQLKRGLMGYLYKNHEKNTIDCLVESYQYTLSAQTTTRKSS